MGFPFLGHARRSAGMRLLHIRLIIDCAHAQIHSLAFHSMPALRPAKLVGTLQSATFCRYSNSFATDAFSFALHRLPPSPEGEWWEMIDESSGLPYYYHTKTGETVWERPEAFIIPLNVLQVRKDVIPSLCAS